MSVIKSKHIGSKIAFVGRAYSKQEEFAELLCKIFINKGENYIKFSISDPVKTAAKEKYFSEDHMLFMAISSEVRKVKPSHWMDILKEKINHVDESCHIVVNDVRHQNDVVELTTLGFKIININLGWMERFNNLMNSTRTNSDHIFRNTVKAFHYDDSDLLPNYFWDYKIDTMNEKYDLMYQLTGYNKNEIVSIEMSCN